MSTPHDCSVVIPVYNSQEILPTLIERLAITLPQIAEHFEVILVNDDSPDGSWECICGLAVKYPWLHGIHLMRNYGQHNATLCGARAAHYEIIVTMDDDLQHPPEEIPILIDKLSEGYDVVYGIPRRRPHNWWRNWFSVTIKRLLANIMGINTIRDIGSFRAFRASLRRAFVSYQNPNIILDVLLSWGTSRFATVSVNEEERQMGRSNYSFIKLLKVTMTVLTGFSTLPLRISSLLGFAFTIFGALVFFYVVGIYLMEGSIPGFPFLASIISLFSGAQLFALGIIGEYLARIFDRNIDRPPYIVAETTGKSAL